MTVPLAFDQPTRPLDDQLPYFSVHIRKEERRNQHSALLRISRQQLPLRSMVSTASTTASASAPAPKSTSSSGTTPMEVDEAKDVKKTKVITDG